jgi:glycosyltransferase involved in cell wall biosynthesis
VKVSIIMPVERVGGTAERAIASILSQQAPFPFELIIVSAELLPLQAGVRNVVEANRNPATRRNRAVSEAAGEILAFIDDDAFAQPGWLARAAAYVDSNPHVVALGGPDPAPADASVAELFSETVLSTPLLGSGIAAHENRPGIFAIQRPTDLALVNLFVRREAFVGFDEAIGYIGEDTALIEGLMQRGEVHYHSGIAVEHRRRPFVLPYVRQRWRYRVKTGELFARGAYRDDVRILTFLMAGAFVLLFPPLIVPYAIATLILGIGATRLPAKYWPLIPAAFAVHHGTYFAAILWGFIRAKLRV